MTRDIFMLLKGAGINSSLPHSGINITMHVNNINMLPVSITRQQAPKCVTVQYAFCEVLNKANILHKYTSVDSVYLFKSH